MEKQKSTRYLTKALTWIGVLFAFSILVFLFLMKDSLTSYISSEIKSQSGTELQFSARILVDSLYNYQANGQHFQLTFLEFGANCPACKRMESVMEEVKSEFTQEVQVVFLNILKPENQELMKYFGVAAIPTQVILDSKGMEYFRHTGYFSFQELQPVFLEKLTLN
jgi:thioredoxin 1